MNGFDQHFSVECLNSIFEDFLNSHFDVFADCARVKTGSDRISLPVFLSSRELHIKAISRQMLEGRYFFSPFLEHEVPKPGSKTKRTISVSTISDSIAQRALYRYLYDAVEPQLTESAYGYRRGRSFHSAVNAVAGHISTGKCFVFDADLRDFFGTVNHDILLKQVDDLALDVRASKVVRRFLKTGGIDSLRSKQYISGPMKAKKVPSASRFSGVPQGGVLSGLLSNLYLAKFDRAIRQRFDGFIRYADDFVICCGSPEECQEAEELVKHQLSLLPPLELNEAKTRTCQDARKGVDFLGFRVKQVKDSVRIRVRGRNVDKFKKRILALLVACDRAVAKDARLKASSENALEFVAERISLKIRGPGKEYLDKLRARGRVVHPHRRCWVGAFRIVTDSAQLKRLDNWTRAQISRFLWKTHRTNTSFREMQAAGLPSLYNCLWRARKKASLPLPEADSD